ncbi:MAG: DUF3575 domain-containing protein [Flavobacteriaceae bacterium]
MKKTVLLILAIIFSVQLSAQEFPNNEIKLNIAGVIAFASVEVGYEYLFDYNQSIDFEVFINDRINFHSEEGSRKFNTNSVKLGYNFYFGTENPGSGLYFNPFVKYRFGDFEEEMDMSLIDPLPGTPFPPIIKTDMDGFIIGLGSGYKWNFSNSFIISVYGNIGRNFSDEVKERFSAIEFHAGAGIGYRF